LCLTEVLVLYFIHYAVGCNTAKFANALEVSSCVLHSTAML
jgi:hypothetical protein